MLKMSKNSVNCSSSVGTEVKFAGNDSKTKMYEPKHKKKLVRVLTVIAYVFSVSLAAITLSLFYLFIYNPGKPGHSVGSNSSVNGRLFPRNNEGVLSINNTYSNYDREEPRALPLEIIQKQTNQIEDKQKSDEKEEKIRKETEFQSGTEKKSFLMRIAGTVSVMN